MSIVEPIIAELDHEAAITKKLLERVPEERFDWKPHEKSMSMAQLASHVAESASWAGAVMTMDCFELPEDYQPYVAKSAQELMEKFDTSIAEAKNVLQGQPDDRLTANWQMKMGGKVVVEMPRAAVIRGHILNHLVHHRGQLSVYLRLNDIPVPSIYGPSADEPEMMG